VTALELPRILEYRDYSTPKLSRIVFLLLEYPFNSISGVKFSRSISKSMNLRIFRRVIDLLIDLYQLRYLSR